MATNSFPIGCTGRLILATRGVEGPGEVVVSIRGGTEVFFAWSEKPLARGTTVLVYEARGERSVDVMEWRDSSDDPLGPPIT